MTSFANSNSGTTKRVGIPSLQPPLKLVMKKNGWWIPASQKNETINATISSEEESCFQFGTSPERQSLLGVEP